MSWDYAELSSLAKDNGGPQALIDKITDEASTNLPERRNLYEFPVPAFI